MRFRIAEFVSFIALTAALPDAVWAQLDLSAQCAAEARYPTLDDPIGKDWVELDHAQAIVLCREAIEFDHSDADARANLARALIKGDFLAEGLAELRIAAAMGSGQAQRQLAIQLEESGEVDKRREAIAFLQQAAESGYVPAFITLAHFLSDEDSVARDDKAAFAWAMRGHEAGDYVATNYLGLFYERGSGVEIDFERSTALFHQAAEAGEAEAMRNYGLALSKGDGVSKNQELAIEWWRKAFAAGDISAAHDIGMAYQDGLGVVRNDEEAVRWFRKGHEGGDFSSTANLAFMIEHGRGGLEKDLSEAFKLYQLAAEGGNDWAMFSTGLQHYEGLGTTRDYSAARAWFHQAAEAGYAEAYYYLGRAFEKGEGVNKDIAQAINWYERGRKQGCIYCITQLGVLHGSGLGFDRDQTRADALYLEAAEAGDGDAMRKVAMAYRSGTLGPDLALAREWDRRAAKLGNISYKLELGRSLAFGVNNYEIDLSEGRSWLEEALSLGSEEAGGLLVLAILMDDSLKDREQQAVNLLVEHARNRAGWALATLAYPGAVLSQMAAMPDPEPWRARLAGRLPADVLFSAAEALRHGRTAKQDFGQAIALTQRAETDDILNARGHELELLISLNLYTVALKRYAEFTTSDEYFALPDNQRVSFERRFANKIETCFRNAPGSTELMIALADRGLTAAATTLGNFYNNKSNPEYNVSLARHWYKRAVELGSDSSRVSLGYMASFGLGLEKDEELAFDYYREAAEAGNAAAQHNLAVLYDEGRGVAKDPAESVRWLRLASSGGNLVSYSRLALNLFRGEGTDSDPSAAVEALRRSVDSLDPSGIELMARAHFEGSGVPRNIEAGLRWLRLLAGLHNDPVGAELLARAHAGAWNVTPDAEQAYYWLDEARVRGGDWATNVSITCAQDRTVRCIVDAESFEPYLLMKKPIATLAPLPNLADDEDRLLRQRDAALATGNVDTAQAAFHSLDILYRLYDKPDRLLANNAINVLRTELQMERVHGSRDNYFALFTTSCSWANASEAARAAGRKEAAVLFAKVAVNRLQQARGFIADLDDEVRECFIEMHRDRYRELAGRFLELGRFAEAENVLGMLKDFEHQGYTGDSSDRGRSYSTMPMTGAQADVLANYNRAAALFTGNIDEPHFAGALADLTAGLMALEDAPQTLVENDQRGPSSMQEVLQRSGRRDLAALQAVVQPDRIYWLLTDLSGQKVVRVPLLISDLTRQVRDYREALARADEDLHAKAQALYQMVFQSVDAELQAMGTSEVLLSLDENLRYIPFAALYDGKGWLVERYGFANFRGAEELITDERAGPLPRVAGFGVTKAEANFSALPMVETELGAIVIESDTDEGILQGRSRLDETFDRLSFAQAAKEGFGVIHIASHFALDPRQRDKSFLLIGKGDRLHLSAFGGTGGIKFNGAPMVALSACDTAVETRDANGVELDSLARIVRKAGASGVLASLWQVSDFSTAHLMRDFYRERYIGQASNAQALRVAQLNLIEAGRRGKTSAPEGENPADYATFDNPFFWAPFVVTADVAGSRSSEVSMTKREAVSSNMRETAS